MKKLNPKAYCFLLTGLICQLVYRFVDLLSSRNREFPVLEMRLSEKALERIGKLFFGVNLLATIVVATVITYLIYRVVKNFKVSTSQGYISFILVISIIFSVFNLLSLVTLHFLSVINLLINGLLITGCFFQKQDKQQPIPLE